MDTPVSFNLAKLLKEKEFDKQCLNFYTKPNSKMFGIDEHYRNYPIKNVSKKLYTVGVHAVLNIENIYFAPTTAEVVAWLYEKHGIWIVSDAVGDKNIYPKWNYKIVDLTNPNSNIDWELNQLTVSYEEIIKNSYDSPTEAYETAIEYCLTKLI